MKVKNFFKLPIVVILVLLLALPAISAAGEKKYELVTVVKLIGIPWFNRMEEGVKKAANDLDVNAYLIGPPTADVAQQVRMVEDMVAKGVDAICVVPTDAKALEPTFRKAKSKGILVFTNESPYQKGADWDIECFEDAVYAHRVVDAVVEQVGDEGGYVSLVGGLTVPMHNLWADLATEYIKKKYPKLREVTSRLPTAESIEDSYKGVLEVIKAHPDLKVIFGWGSLGPPGAAQAIREKGLQGKIAISGATIPSQVASYFKDGTLRKTFVWDPINTGYAYTYLEKKVLDGEKIIEGMEIPGVGPILSIKGKIITIDNLIAITADNVEKLF